jgi:hypothetical protein
VTAIVDNYGPVDLQALKQSAFVGVARYVSVVAGKCITPAEFDSYQAEHLTTVFVYEDDAADGLGGTAVGIAKGQVAHRVLSSLGVDLSHTVCYFAFDFDIQPSQYAVGIECVKAFGQTGGFIPGIYGPSPFIRYAETQGIKYGWMSGATSWNNGITAGQLRQEVNQVVIGGAAVDVDTILSADYGQWPRPAAPKPSPVKEVNVNVVVVGPGSPPEWTKSVQSLLHGKFGQNVGADGVFGSQTVAAVENVQRFFKLPVTAQVDATLWSILLGL